MARKNPELNPPTKILNVDSKDSFFYFRGREPETTIKSLSDLHQQLHRKFIYQFFFFFRFTVINVLIYLEI